MTGFGDARYSIPAFSGAGIIESQWIDDAGDFHRVVTCSNDPHANDPFDKWLGGNQVAFSRLGLVRLDRTATRYVLSWNVSDVNEQALAEAVAFLIGKWAERPVDLRYFYAGWNIERWSSGVAAAKRILSLAAMKKTTPFPFIRTEPHAIRKVEDAAPLIRAAMRAWRDSGGQGSINDNMFGGVRSFLQTYRVRKNDDAILFDHVGRNSMISQILGERWRQNVPGTLFNRSHTDHEFEDGVCQPYYDVLDKGEPVYDHVRALLVQEGVDPYWISYQRLIMPSRNSADGSTSLVVAIAPTQNVSIPLI